MFIGQSTFYRSRISNNIVVLAGLLIFGSVFQPVSAQVDTRWIGTDGNWDDAMNWDNGVPVGNFNAIFEAGTGTVSQDVEQLVIAGLAIDAADANIVLNQPLAINQTLQWNQGQINGPLNCDFLGVGELIDVQLETTFNNFGLMQIGSDQSFVRLETNSGNAIWNNKRGSAMEFPTASVVGTFDGGPQGIINNEADAEMRFVESATYVVWETNNDGLIEVGNGTGVFSGALFIGDFQQSETGVIKLNDGFVDFFSEVEIFGKVTGNGSILNLSSTFDGELDPGGPVIGSIEVAGALQMTNNTVTSMQIGPDLTSDLVNNIGGSLQLDGILNIEALPGATVGIYTLFTYNNSSGLQFENIAIGDMPAGFEGFLFLDTADQSIKLNVTDLVPVILFGDVNLDGSVNLLDVAPFIELVSNGTFQEEADINGDGEVNLLDVALFVALLSN